MQQVCLSQQYGVVGGQGDTQTSLRCLVAQWCTPWVHTLTVSLCAVSFQVISVVTGGTPSSTSPRHRRSVLLLKKGLELKLISRVGGPPAVEEVNSTTNGAMILHGTSLLQSSVDTALPEQKRSASINYTSWRSCNKQLTKWFSWYRLITAAPVLVMGPVLCEIQHQTLSVAIKVAERGLTGVVPLTRGVNCFDACAVGQGQFVPAADLFRQRVLQQRSHREWLMQLACNCRRQRSKLQHPLTTASAAATPPGSYVPACVPRFTWLYSALSQK